MDIKNEEVQKESQETTGDMKDITPMSEISPLSAEDVAKWLEEIGYARKREENFRKEAKKVVDIYEAEKGTENQFNILYSNTETLSPALYSTVPKPIAKRRFEDADPMGKCVADVITRAVEEIIDSGNGDEDSFDDLLRSAVLDTLVPGRGVIRFSYLAQKDPTSDKIRETVIGQSVQWDMFLHGYAKTWTKVPWICYIHRMSEEELEGNFGKDAKNVQCTAPNESSDDSDAAKNTTEEEKNVKLATVYEVWDKDTKQVHFFSDQKGLEGIRSLDDPLKLTGFFNCARPIQFTKRVSGLLPVPLYKFYETQANELNKITIRIMKLIDMLKIRGFYDGALGEQLSDLLTSPDGTLKPLANAAALYGANGTSSLDSGFWFMPLKDIPAVLQQLYAQREQAKQIVYEITGISDILRGSSMASETATAQNIKNQWGTLRIKEFQKEVARYARDAVRIVSEVVAGKFSPESLKDITNLPYPTQVEKQQAELRVNTVKQQAMMAQQGTRQPPMPGQPIPPPQPLAPPPQPNPADLELLNKPTWEEITEFLRQDVTRNFRIDIETNSTLAPDNQEDQKNISDLLNALSQVLNGLAPLVKQGDLPFELLKGILLTTSRKFAFGVELEEFLAKMQAPPPPPPPQPDPTQVQKGQLELQKMQLELQAAGQEAQAAQELAKIKQETERQKATMETQKMALEMQALQEEIAAKKELAMMQHEQAMVELRQKADLAAQQHQQKLSQAIFNQQSKMMSAR